ncbi:hypothetical protein PIB30_093107, partial [Stylosanthes scabra]|nr:hypothetical protein [Stylosanthes scabra]
MYEVVQNNGLEIELFMKHPISVPVVAEECVPNAGGTHNSPHVTPTKGRIKVYAGRTPTPKNAHGHKRSLLFGEGSSHDVEVQEAMNVHP